MARVLIIESGDDWRALSIPEDWATDDVDRYLNGMAYGRAAVVNVEDMAKPTPFFNTEIRSVGGGLESSLICDELGIDPDSFLPVNGGEYGGGSM